MKSLLLAIGAGLPLISAVVYIVSIVRGASRPQRMTRLLMVVVTALSFGALWAAHDKAAIWLALASFIEALAIWALSLRRGVGGRDRLDYICFGLCMAGLALWLASGDSSFGLGMSIAADFIACVPALRKTLRWPHTESVAFYALGTAAGAAVLFASPPSPQALVYPAYIMLINGAFVAAILWPRRIAAVIPTETSEP